MWQQHSTAGQPYVSRIRILLLTHSEGEFVALGIQYAKRMPHTVRPGSTIYFNKKKNLRGLSPRANYTDRAAAAGRRS
jgi:hypothetical protein